MPEIDVLIIPIGRGTGISGAMIAAKILKPELRIIGVQSLNSPAAYESWKTKSLIERPNKTFDRQIADVSPHKVIPGGYPTDTKADML